MSVPAKRSPHPAIAVLDEKRAEIMASVPAPARGLIEWDRLRTALALQIANNPRLGQCSPLSILTAVMQITSRGLDLADRTQVSLVPYGQVCQVIVGYQGLIELVYRTGLVDRLTAQIVYETDDIELDLATGHVKHSVSKAAMLAVAKGQSRGEMMAAYTRVWMKGNPEPVTELMLRDEWDKIVDNAKQKGRGRVSDAYKDWPGEMWKRSIINRALKRIPKTRELAETLENQIEVEFGPRQSGPAQRPSAMPDDLPPVIDAEPSAEPAP